MSASEQTAKPADYGEQTFEDFFARHYPAVLALATVLSGSRAAAEDITQETFVAAFRRWPRLQTYDRPDAWVRRVVANHAASASRRRVRDASLLVRLVGRAQPANEVPPSHDVEFWTAVRALPARQAQCLALFYVEDRSVADIADIFELSESTVRVHLHTGRRALATRLGETYEEAEQ